MAVNSVTISLPASVRIMLEMRAKKAGVSVSKFVEYLVYFHEGAELVYGDNSSGKKKETIGEKGNRKRGNACGIDGSGTATNKDNRSR